MATNERVINRSIRTTEHRFADPQNVYWLSNALSINILRCLWIVSSHNIYSELISCRSLILAKCKSNKLTLPPSYMCLFVGSCMVKQAIYRCYHRLISWRATFCCCQITQMCWLIIIIIIIIMADLCGPLPWWTRITSALPVVSTSPLNT